MPCFSQSLQLAVEVILKFPEDSCALYTCKHLVAHFNRSTQVNLFVEAKTGLSPSQDTSFGTECEHMVEFSILYSSQHVLPS